MINEKPKNWFRRHWVISIMLGLFVFGMIGSIFDSGDNVNKNVGDLTLTGQVISETSDVQNSNQEETEIKLTTKEKEESTEDSNQEDSQTDNQQINN